jgi:solute carrier family 35 protein C2
MAAVAFLGESFSAVNALGLAVLVAGVFLFNWTKYRKIARGQARGGKPAPDAGAAHREDGEPAADEEAVRLMPRAGAGAPRRIAAPLHACSAHRLAPQPPARLHSR